MKRFLTPAQATLALALCLALQTGSFAANITNTASATYQDAAGNPYTATSLQVVIITPPVVTAPANLTLDVGVAMAGVQVSATNAPTTYTLTNAPIGLTIDNNGLISGTPGVSSAAGSPYRVTVTATNSAGTGTSAVFTITVRGAANIVLTKTADAATAVSGNTITFTIAYQNTGAGTASNVVITDAIPAGSTFVNGSITGGGTLAAGTITWTIPTILSGGSGSVTFKVTVN